MFIMYCNTYHIYHTYPIMEVVSYLKKLDLKYVTDGSPESSESSPESLGKPEELLRKKFKFFYNEFKKFNIKFVYEVTDELTGRILVTTNSDKANYRYKLARVSNGLVIQYNYTNDKFEFGLLACSPPGLKFRCKLRKINSNFDKYSIYEAKDGTIFTMYWYLDSWRLSTTGGYDVTKYTWQGAKTYEEIVSHVLNHVHDMSLEEFQSKLDKNYSYTFGFKHPTFHPFMATMLESYDMWFVCDYDRINHNLYYDIDTNHTLSFMNKQTELSEITNVHQLIMNCKTAYEDWQKDNSKQNFGYILRSNIRDENANVLLESSLMRNLRQLFYNVRTDKTCDRTDYVCLSAYLNTTISNKFLKMFPQFKDKFNKLDNMLNNIIDGLIYDTSLNEYTDIANILKPDIEKIVNIKNSSKKIIYDHLRSLNYIKVISSL